MARKKSSSTKKTQEPQAAPVKSYRYPSKRKNNPPAGLAAQGKIRETPKLKFAYDPHLPPVLRFDATGASDNLPELLQAARSRALTAEEAQKLAEALRRHEPWLEWAGKREKKEFEVDPVALHIHERMSAQAILKVAAREDPQRELFADPQQEYREAVQFYQHEVDWANRMILGDSLQVMASLAHRENLAGKVQMIYMDPPYGIKFSSNFQPEIGKRDVKDKEADLTREPEMVKAYRDTWTLGVHSYLAYLRDRLILCRELLADSGSVFVQISDENLHRVRGVMDEVFGANQIIAMISFVTTGGQTSDYLPSTTDHILWYCKDSEKIRVKTVYARRGTENELPATLSWYLSELNGHPKRLQQEDLSNVVELEKLGHPFWLADLLSRSGSKTTQYAVNYEGRTTVPHRGGWRTSSDGMQRLAQAERLQWKGEVLLFRRFKNDFWLSNLSTLWTDTQQGGFRESDKVYVVQTNQKVIERCLLMTTDPGDLVLDPTCGSGTTAYVAEQWGRRWITMDTSRVALALARQRLLTAKFDYYKLRPVNAEDLKCNPHGPWLNNNGDTDSTSSSTGPHTFDCKTVPHITLKSIAQNVALDAIFAKHQPILDEKLAALNKALKTVSADLRQRLLQKLYEKEKREGKKSITDADRRRWLLPKTEWKEWEVPFDTDNDWPKNLQTALTEYRQAWRVKMDEVNACISANAEQEELVDQPQIIRNVVRVSGPFTMEAVMPAEESLGDESPIEGEVEELETFGRGDPAGRLYNEPTNADAYLNKMLRLLRADGVRFPNNKILKFTRLEPCSGEDIHAEGEWESEKGDPGKPGRRVAVSFGPQFGPVTAYQVENILPVASRRGFDDLVFAGFSFDGAAQAIIQDDPNPRVRCHLAHIRPDVNMGELLKETPNSQIFTVFGSPRTKLDKTKDGQFIIKMEGVDIYNPVENTILPTSADKVAAWFLDGDYDGRTFCITQAFFPDKNAWDKLARALKGVIDEARFEALSGTVSLPFPPGKHKRAAVKVIDPRGNEVMRVLRLPVDGRVKYDSE